MQRWIRVFLQGRWFRGSNRRWWAGAAEATLAAGLLLLGVVWLSVQVTSLITESTEERGSIVSLAVYMLLAIALIGLGVAWMVRLVLHVTVSAERRGALTNRAAEFEPVRLSFPTVDLPTVPQDRQVPEPGSVLPFRLIPSPRNVLGLITAAFFSVITVAMLTILTPISLRALMVDSSVIDRIGELTEKITPDEFSRIPQRPYLAVGLLLALIPAAGWSIYHLVRQLMKLAGIGPSSVELSRYPLKPGMQCRLFFLQTGRVRLNLLDLELICQEEVTYNQGTDIRTERAVVYQQRLFRSRGVSLRPGKPVETELDLEIPDRAMHSFQSSSNRIRWKIVVTAKTRNWPRLRRTFPILVHPAVSESEDAASTELAGENR